ncbi:MAG: hypothetical protein IKV96_00545 [Firmicutes bacterium]|nr:hypothetical protein [Bacillota bacterium]
MNNRYIERFRLPQRQYVPGAPVVLAAGVLLEDTKSLRLVAQLKWTNISARPVSKISVVINTLADDGSVLKTAYCVYEMDHIARGQSFGYKTAVPLQLSDGSAISVELTAVKFVDGLVWKNEGDSWVTLPEFELMELEPELEQFLRKNMRKGRYQYKQPADLWYCTCGGVNRMSETRCHRCGYSFANVSKYCAPESLVALLQAKKDAEAKRAEDIEKLKADAAAKISGFKAAAEKKVAEVAESREKAKAEKEKAKADKAAAEADTPMAPPSGDEPAGEAGLMSAKKKGKKGIIIAVAVLVVALIATGVMFLPDMMGGNGGRVKVNITTPYDGEKYHLQFEADQEGKIIISRDELQKTLPFEVESISVDGAAYIGDDIDDFLVQSFHVASLVGANGRFGSDGSEAWFWPENSGIAYIFTFDNQTELTGYFVGYFTDEGDGKWGCDITECSYDIGPLVRSERELFQNFINSVEDIPETDVADSGAAYYIPGYNMGTNHSDYVLAYKCMLWSRYNRCLEDYKKPISEFEADGPEANETDHVWKYYLLIDENNNAIGYTMRTSYDSSAAGTYDISTPYDIEKVIYSVPIESEALKFELTALQEAFPEAGITAFDLTDIPAVETDINNYLTISDYMNGMLISGSHGATSQMRYTSIYNEAYALLLYGDNNRLVGYSIGAPDLNAQGTSDITVTLCDYDMTEYIDMLSLQFGSSAVYNNYSYIPLEEAQALADAGEAAKILTAPSYHNSYGAEELYKMSDVYFWTRIQFPENFNYFLRDASYLSNEEVHPELGEHEQHILLFDNNTKVIGFTIINPHYE